MLTGGRGKAGGMKLADDPADAARRPSRSSGSTSAATSCEVWIEQASDIAKEYYLSVTFDRGTKQPLFMFTTEGGVEIEQVAEENPMRSSACTSTRSRASSRGSGAPARLRRRCRDPASRSRSRTIVGKLYRCFVESDAMLSRSTR